MSSVKYLANSRWKVRSKMSSKKLIDNGYMINVEDKANYFEQYFTKPNIAKDSVRCIFDDLNNFDQFTFFKSNKFHFVEPSCGNGAFVRALREIDIDVKLTSLDIDYTYKDAIIHDFLKVDKNLLNIEEDEKVVFFGCPPSLLTKEFLKHCQILDRKSIAYFIVEENKIRNCIENKVIVSSSIIKNFGHDAFLFGDTDFITQGAYLLVRIIFDPNVYNVFSRKDA